MIGIGITTAFLVLQTLPAPRSVQWENIGEGDRTYEFIDPGTITREGDIASYTTRLTIVIPGEDGIAMMVLRHAMNCSTGRAGFLGIDGYNEEGQLVASRRTRPADVVYDEIPGAGAPLVRRRVCGAPAQ